MVSEQHNVDLPRCHTLFTVRLHCQWKTNQVLWFLKAYREVNINLLVALYNQPNLPLTSLNSFTVLKYSLCFSNNSKYWSFNWSLLILFSCFFFSICWNILGNSNEEHILTNSCWQHSEGNSYWYFIDFLQYLPSLYNFWGWFIYLRDIAQRLYLFRTSPAIGH